jgi:hypothetical protein
MRVLKGGGGGTHGDGGFVHDEGPRRGTRGEGRMGVGGGVEFGRQSESRRMGASVVGEDVFCGSPQRMGLLKEVLERRL